MVYDNNENGTSFDQITHDTVDINRGLYTCKSEIKKKTRLTA